MPIQNPTRTYSDLDLNFQSNPITGDVSKNTGNLAVINALRYLLLTNHFDVPFSPSIGANITRLLFENADEFTAAALQKEITNTINNYEPRVSLTSVAVQANIQQNGFNVALTFFINNQVAPVTINMFLQRIQ